MHTKVHWIIELPDFLTRLDFVMNIHPKAQYEIVILAIGLEKFEISRNFSSLENFDLNLIFPHFFDVWKISI